MLLLKLVAYRVLNWLGYVLTLAAFSILISLKKQGCTYRERERRYEGGIVCKHCGKTELLWTKGHYNQWRLFDRTINEFHYCLIAVDLVTNSKKEELNRGNSVKV